MSSLIDIPRHVVLRTLLFWVLSTTLIDPIAVYIATISWWLVSPVNLNSNIDFILRDPPLISVIRAVVFGIVAGVIIGISQQTVLRSFSKLGFWITATIIGLTIGMIVVDFSQSWLITLKPAWLVTVWIAFIPSLMMAILQALVIVREGHSPKWWLLAGGIPFSFITFGFYLDGIPALFLGGLVGAILSVIAIPTTFLKKYASSKDASRTAFV